MKKREKSEKDILKKIEKEKKIMAEMIKLYCRKNHKDLPKNSEGVCLNCQKLLSYSSSRIDGCPFMEEKTFCSNCKVHCYNRDMREQIKKVMRFSGPRMLLCHPFLVVYHMVCSAKEKRCKDDKKAVD